MDQFVKVIVDHKLHCFALVHLLCLVVHTVYWVFVTGKGSLAALFVMGYTDQGQLGLSFVCHGLYRSRTVGIKLCLS